MRAKERLEELQASSATDGEYRNNSQAVDEARKSLHSTYDQLMADDLEEKVARIKWNHANWTVQQSLESRK